MTKKAETIKFLKVRKVKSPTRAFEFDAGIDFFVPEFTKLFIRDLKEKNALVFDPPCNCGSFTSNSGLSYSEGTSTLTMAGAGSSVNWDLADHNDTLIKFDDEKGENYFLLPPTSRIMIPSGIKSRMAKPGRALIAGNKSGIATKHGLVFGAQVVDYTYMGEIHLSVINTSSKNVRIYENMKILQFVETPVFNSQVKIVDDGDTTEAINFYVGLEDDRKDGGFGSTDENKTEKK